MRVPNDEIRRRAGIKKISTQVRRRRWKWIGHVLRMALNRNAYVALCWAPCGKRSRGRPRETWRRTVEKECAELGLTSWVAAAALGKNRDRWRALIPDPIPHSGQGTKHVVLAFGCQSSSTGLVLLSAQCLYFRVNPE